MSLIQRLVTHIQRHPQGRIPFVEYMEWVLYDRQNGYYTTLPDSIGLQGDFLTAPHLCPEFGELLAQQFAQMWEILRQPHPFTVLEMGAGQGILAATVVQALRSHHPDCFAHLRYWIVERSPALRQVQQQRLQELALGNRLEWLTWDEISPGTIVGCCFSNELVDAFPVHLVEIHQGQLQEVYVTTGATTNPGDPVTPENRDGAACEKQTKQKLEQQPEQQAKRQSEQQTKQQPEQQARQQAKRQPEQQAKQELEQQTKQQPKQQPEQHFQASFRECLAEPSTPELVQYFQDLGIEITVPPYPEGYRTEVNLAARDWLTQVSDRLHQGYLLTIDYGYPAHRYYHPNRSQGTLQGYYRHAHHNDPYFRPGQQDLTAHVNFTALERWGTALGLVNLGFCPQALFLMALGLGDRLARLSSPSEVAIEEASGRSPQSLQPTLLQPTPLQPTLLQKSLQRRDALHQLINPLGLGNFGVLIQAKGLSHSQQAIPLQGLATGGDLGINLFDRP